MVIGEDFAREWSTIFPQQRKLMGSFRRRSGRLWCRARSGSTGFRRRFRRRCGRLWCRARSGSTEVPGGFGAEPGQLQKMFKNKTLQLLRIPPKPFFQRRQKKVGWILMKMWVKWVKWARLEPYRTISMVKAKDDWPRSLQVKRLSVCAHATCIERGQRFKGSGGTFRSFGPYYGHINHIWGISIWYPLVI